MKSYQYIAVVALGLFSSLSWGQEQDKYKETIVEARIQKIQLRIRCKLGKRKLSSEIEVFKKSAFNL